MRRRIILIFIAVAFVALIAQNQIESYRVDKEERAESQRTLNEIRSNVDALKKQTGASLSWVKALSGEEKHGFGPVMSIELEKEWVTESPILFLGSLKDIATLDESHYQVVFNDSLWISLGIMFNPPLRVSLKAEKELIDQFMSANPNLTEDYGFNNGVALAARIHKIESSQIASSEGYTEVKTGKGVLLGIVFTGFRRL